MSISSRRNPRSIELKRVVVTGLGALTPVGLDVPSFWAAICAGKSGAAPITKFDASGYSARFACELKGLDPEAILGKKTCRQIDPYVQYSLICAEQAVKDARLELEKLDRTRCGVIWTSGLGGLASLEDEIGKWAAKGGAAKVSPFFIPKMIENMGAGMIAMQYGFHGAGWATVSACASSTHALIDALTYIRLGKADLILAGGAEAAIVPTCFAGFLALHALSTRNETPESASRPFDPSRDGFVMGEGACGLVLEELGHALARGATIYGELAGGGFSSDAHHMTSPHPDGLGATLSMRNALEDAQLEPGDIGYLNCHATSTPAGDIGEAKAAATVFADALDKVTLGGTKSMTGHMLGAAGAAEAAIALLSVRDGVIPPTINTSTLDPELPAGLDIVLGHARKKPIQAAMSNTFGFGGQNSTVVFAKYEK